MGAAAAIVALVEISVQIILGDVAGQAFGWTSREALFAFAQPGENSERGNGGRKIIVTRLKLGTLWS